MIDFAYWRWRLIQRPWWRFVAWWCGGIARRIERFHEAWHPEQVIAFRCDMCEARERGGYWE